MKFILILISITIANVILPFAVNAQDSINSNSKNLDLNNLFESKGFSTYSKCGNKFWAILIKGEESVNDVVKSLGIPIDTLSYLAKQGVIGSSMCDKFRTSAEYQLNEVETIFGNPNVPVGELLSTPNSRRLNTRIDIPYDQSTTYELKNYNEAITPSIFDSNVTSYKGNYKFEWDYNLLHHYDGIANYTYIPNSDGSRTFEGAFEFIYDYRLPEIRKQSNERRNDIVKVKGQFLNNKQVGQWVWEKKDLMSGKVEKYSVEYDILGYPNGEYHGGGINAVFRHGKLEYAGYEGRYPETYGRTLKNTFGNYRNNKPVGTWKVYCKDKDTLILEYEDGELVKSGYRDHSTGDWQYYGCQLAEFIRDTIELELERLRIRSTPKIKLK